MGAMGGRRREVEQLHPCRSAVLSNFAVAAVVAAATANTTDTNLSIDSPLIDAGGLSVTKEILLGLFFQSEIVGRAAVVARTHRVILSEK
jgi:hypothetical protein